MAVRYYNTMPDAETVRRITAMGDTIELTSGAAPTASAGTGYVAPRRDSTFMGDPALTTNDPNAARDPAFGTAQVASAREWIADTAYRNAEQEFQQLVANYNRNLQENPRAFQPGGAMYGQQPPTFESVLARQRSNIEGGASMNFTGSAGRYGVPQYQAPATAARTNTITSTGAFNPGVQPSQPAATTTTTQQTPAQTAAQTAAEAAARAAGTVRTGSSYGDRLSSLGIRPGTSNPTANTGTSARGYTYTGPAATPDPNTVNLQPGSSGYGAASRFLQPFQQPTSPTTNPTVTTPNYSWMNPTGISTTNLGSTDNAGNVYTPETPGGNGEGGTTVTGGVGGGGSATNDILGRVMSLMNQNGFTSGAGYDIVAHYWAQVTGRSAPPPEALGITDRSAPITAAQLFASMSNAGYDPATGTRTSTPGQTPTGPGGETPTGPGGGGGGETPVGPGGGGETPVGPGGPGTGGPGTGGGGEIPVGPGTGGGGPGTGGGGTPGTNIPPAGTVPGTGPGGGGPGTIPGGGNNPPPGGIPSGPGTGGWNPEFTDEINQMARNDREFGLGRGNALDTSLTEYGARRESEYADWTQNLFDSYNSPFGYNDEERGYILPGDRLNQYAWTPEDTRNLGLTDQEYASIEGAGRDETGDYALNARLREGAQGVEEAVDAGDAAYNRALDAQDAAMRPWIDERMLRRDQNVAGDIGNVLSDTQGRIRSATSADDLRAREGLGTELSSIDTTNAANVDSWLSNPNLQYSDATRSGVMGDLTSGESRIRGSFDPAAMRTGAGFTDRLTGIADANAAESMGAIDRGRLRYDPNVAARNTGTLTDSAGRIRAATDTGRLSQDPNFTGNVEGALSGGESNLRGTVDPSRLGLSSEFTEGYNWTPEDSEALAGQSARLVSTAAAGRRADLEQRARAAGNASPLGLESAAARSRIAEDVAAADAITNARIAGRERELSTTRGREEMRLGAEQDISGRQSAIESELGSRRLTSTYNTEQMRQDAERARAQIQAGAESDIANRDISTNLEQEGRRIAAETSATGVELGQLNTNTSNRLGALATGEQMRVGSEQAAGQIEANQEQQILDRRTQAQQQMEAERVRAAQAASQARANAASTEAGRRTSNILNAENLRTNAANTAARTISDAEAGIANRYTDARLGTEQQRLEAEQFITNSGLNTEQYLGSSRLNAAQQTNQARVAGRENQATRGAQAATYLTGLQNDTSRFLATNRQNAQTTGRTNEYNTGMGIYQAGAQAGQTVGGARMNQQEGYRSRLTDLATNAGQNATVSNQQRVSNFGTQGGVQNTATGNAIRNYGIPGTAEKIGGMILGSLADGGTVNGEPAIVGEAGPELVIDIPAASKLPERGLGRLVGNAASGWNSADRFNRTAIGANTPVDETGHPMDEGTVIEQPKPKNRLWESLKSAVYEPGVSDPEGASTETPTSSGTGKGLLTGLLMGKKKGGGLLSTILPGMADGALTPAGGDGDQPVSRFLAPGVKYVNGPQVDNLGENGPEAVVPLTDRPGAKLKTGDVPSLLNAYRAGKPIPTLADGGTTPQAGPLSLADLQRIAAERRRADEQFNQAYGGGDAPAPPITAPVPMASRQQLPAPASRLLPPTPAPAPPPAGPMSLDQLQQIAAQRRREDEQFSRIYGGVPTPTAPNPGQPRAIVDPVEEFLPAAMRPRTFDGPAAAPYVPPVQPAQPTIGRVPDYVPPTRVAPAAFNPEELANPYGRMAAAPPQPQNTPTPPASAPRPAAAPASSAPNPAQQQIDDRRNMTQAAAPAPPPPPQQQSAPTPAPAPSNSTQPGMGMYAAAAGAPSAQSTQPASQPAQQSSRLIASTPAQPAAPSTVTREPQAEQPKPQQQPNFQPERPKALADGGTAGADKKREGFDWFGLETMRRLAGNWTGDDQPQPPAPAASGGDNMDFVRDSVRRQMASQKKQGVKGMKGGVTPPPTQTNRRKEARQ